MHDQIQHFESSASSAVAVVTGKIAIGSTLIASSTEKGQHAIALVTPNWINDFYFLGVNTVQFIQLATGLWILFSLWRGLRDEFFPKSKKPKYQKPDMVTSANGGYDKPKPR